MEHKSEQIVSASDTNVQAPAATGANEKHILAVMEKTGWTRKQAISEMRAAKASVGISYRDYNMYDFHTVDPEDQAEEYQKILDAKARRLQQKEQCIASAMNIAGWTREQAEAQIAETRKRMSISYKDYQSYNFCLIPPAEQEKKFREILQKRAKKERKEKKNEKFIQLVMANTGWTHEEAQANMDRAQELFGAEYKDYASYRFWELDEDIQSTYFTKGHANALRKKYNTNKKNTEIFMHKSKFNEVFSDYLGRPWLCNTAATLEDFKKTFQNEPRIIYKPLSASCGSGVAAFDLTPDNMESVYNKLSSLPEGVVEGYILQHPEMRKFSLNSVNTVRLVTVHAKGEVNLLYGAMRMGGGNSVVDNFHSGGVLALLDLSCGEIVTYAIDLAGKMYTKHPVTKEKIVGFKVPHWDAIVDMIKKAGKIVPGVGYVGWDIAVTEKGPLLIEGNTAPAPNVFQLPYAKKLQGVLYAVEKYL